MENGGAHLFLRLATVFLIFHLLNSIRKHITLSRRVLIYWYLLGISQACFLLFPFIKELPISFLLIVPFKFMMLGFSFFLWTVSKAFTDESFRFKYYHYIIFIIIQIIGLSATRINGKVLFLNGTVVPEQTGVFIALTSIFFQISLSGLALYNIYYSYRSEQDQSLLFLKRFFLVSASVSEITMLLIFFAHREEGSEIRRWVVTLVHFLFLAVSFLLLRFDPKNQNSEKQIQDTEKIKETFMNFLLNQKEILFQECNLSDLSIKAGLPEYRLRKLINTELGFSNFNQFINHHRISEACRMLESEEYTEVPISRIALNVGFNSITTFNRVFKEMKNTSPSQYRLNCTSTGR